MKGSKMFQVLAKTGINRPADVIAECRCSQDLSFFGDITYSSRGRLKIDHFVTYFPRRARASKRSDIIFLRSISGTGQLRRMCGLHKHKQTNGVRGVTKNIPSRPEASESMFRSIRAAMNGLSLVWFAAPNAAHVIVPDSCGPRVAGAPRPTTAQDSRTPQGFWLLIMIKARIWLQLYLGRSAIGHCLGRTIRITNLAYRSTLSWEHCDLSLTLQGNVTPA